MKPLGKYYKLMSVVFMWSDVFLLFFFKQTHFCDIHDACCMFLVTTQKHSHRVINTTLHVQNQEVFCCCFENVHPLMKTERGIGFDDCSTTECTGLRVIGIKITFVEDVWKVLCTSLHFSYILLKINHLNYRAGVDILFFIVERDNCQGQIFPTGVWAEMCVLVFFTVSLYFV